MPKTRNLKYLREKHGLSQRELADKLGVTEATIGNWENDRTSIPRPATERVATFFNVDVTDFRNVDLELMDATISADELRLTEQEAHNILLFRSLPDNIKQALRYLIISAAEHEAQNGES